MTIIMVTQIKSMQLVPTFKLPKKLPFYIKGIHSKFKNLRIRKNVRSSNETCILIG